MILCRNLAIYLEPESSGLLWEKLAGALAPGGILVTGKAMADFLGSEVIDFVER